MTYSKCRLAALLGAAAIIAYASAYPQEPAQTTAPPTAPAAATAPPTTPVPVDRKKALQFGFHPEILKGIPVLCRDEPISGTRITNKRCIREDQFAPYLAQLQKARDARSRNGCDVGDFCGNLGAQPDRSRMGMGMAK